MKKLLWLALGAAAAYAYICYKNNEAHREAQNELSKQEEAVEQVKQAAHAVKEAVVDGYEQVKKASKH